MGEVAQNPEQIPILYKHVVSLQLNYLCDYFFIVPIDYQIMVPNAKL